MTISRLHPALDIGDADDIPVCMLAGMHRLIKPWQNGAPR